MTSFAFTDVGRQRESNEDSVATESIGNIELIIVADGMGGHTAGEVASQLAIESITEMIRTALENDRTDYESILEEAITAANEEIHAHSESDSSLSGMGTTAVVGLCIEDEAIIANVGDSRGYHIGNEIEQVTVDQSLVQELVEQGQISQEEAADHPQSNVISQSLGTTDDVDPDFYRRPINGTVLLCSDGLTDEVSDENIAKIVDETEDIEGTAKGLIHAANQNGGNDNISVALYTDK